MAVNLVAPDALDPVAGVRCGVTSLGVRRIPRDDLCVFELAEGASVAASFTRNAFCAAPVTIAREHLVRATPRYLVVNSGNANAGTGASGLESSRRVCALLAEPAGCSAEQVLPFSTGVVGEPLDTAPFVAALPRALAALDADGWIGAGRAIMTTDTVLKGVSRRFEVDGKQATITGIVKGSGMIRPDMATMLCFVATDAAVSPVALERCLARAVDESFNRITVDGDTSTNDACVLVATGAAENELVATAEGGAFDALALAVTDVCRWLAQAVVRDGEGATKFITVEVGGGRTRDECLQVAYTVAHSPLVKTAMSASDANWGRILAAVGRAGIVDLDIDAVRMHLGDVLIVEHGARARDYTEEAGAAVMAEDEIRVRIELGRGDADARVWTCDLSHEYVTINADYRT